MRRAFIAGMLLFACIVIDAARAAAYDDYARGLAANLQLDSDTALSTFTAALAAGDLVPSLKPNAYYGRGLANIRKENCAAARTDAAAALVLKPDYESARFLRAGANECLGEFALALAEHTELIAAKPTAGSYSVRGGLRWHMGDFAGAAADFAQVVQLAPKYSYGVIRMALAQMRAGAVDTALIKRAMSPLDDVGWPGPVLLLISGKSTPEAVAAAAARGEGEAVIGQKCEADFYTAEWWLGRGDVASARPLLHRAVANCPHQFIEFREARIELERLH